MSIWFGFTTAMKGAPYTIGVSIFAVILGLIFGFVLAMMRMSKIWPFRIVSGVYIDIVRGTPMVVQALIFAYGVPQLLQKSGIPFRWPELHIPCMLVCGMNSAAYMAEIIRGGLQAVEKGQMEAAMSLGMTHSQAMRLVIIPQAFRIILPSLGNEFVTMIKETAVLSYAGTVEILRRAALLSAATFETFIAYIGAALAYMVFTIPLSKLVLLMEKKLSGKGIKAKAEDTSSVIEAEELENEQERLADQTAAYRETR
ncbi:MAG: amino acid ABC transporter permease [Eubacterium sp.]|nr:amino acid ABC transporter permease [Eubacterium sp.]